MLQHSEGKRGDGTDEPEIAASEIPPGVPWSAEGSSRRGQFSAVYHVSAQILPHFHFVFLLSGFVSCVAGPPHL